MTLTTRSKQLIGTPIDSTEFYNAFLKALCRVEGSITNPSRRLRIGLAVSGGVDSTALAVLCHGLTREHKWRRNPRLMVEFKAFIVDHNAREGSTKEAEQVRKRLKPMGTRLPFNALTIN